MEKTRTYHLSSSSAGINKLYDYFILLKPRLTLMVVFTSVIAYLLAAEFSVSFQMVCLLFTGGFMVAGASNALNQAIERDFDKCMKRTEDRPIAAGRISYSNGILVAGMFSVIGISLLAVFNPLTAFLGTLSLLTYAFVYTPLKRYSQAAVFVGTIPGAMPVLIGCVAFEGVISPLGLSLFAIQVLWQLPHFWAIGFLGFDDYQKAGFKFVPERNGKPSKEIMIQAIVASFILIPLSILASNVIGLHLISTVLLIVCAAGFCLLSIRFYQKKNRSSALALMFASLIYLPSVLSIILMDQI